MGLRNASCNRPGIANGVSTFAPAASSSFTFGLEIGERQPHMVDDRALARCAFADWMNAKMVLPTGRVAGGRLAAHRDARGTTPPPWPVLQPSYGDDRSVVWRRRRRQPQSRGAGRKRRAPTFIASLFLEGQRLYLRRVIADPPGLPLQGPQAPAYIRPTREHCMPDAGSRDWQAAATGLPDTRRTIVRNDAPSSTPRSHPIQNAIW